MFMALVSLLLFILFLISVIGIIFPKLLNWILKKFDAQWTVTRKIALIMSIILFFMVAVAFGVTDSFNPDPNKYKDKSSIQPNTPTVKKPKLVKKIVVNKPISKPIVTKPKTQTPPPNPSPKPNPIKKTITPTTPVKKKSPTPTTSKEQKTASPKTVYYSNCSAAKAAGAAPLYKGDPGYRSALDRDHDGVACEK